ncbi:uncharacterized protein METZ01_LOCUS138941 [marine metagenome]|uniref:Uncharacterized protein n=1 Tax=marine metagenome TaxID=408172 RepID=A0A381ZBD3_9ZZZZ
MRLVGENTQQVCEIQRAGLFDHNKGANQGILIPIHSILHTPLRLLG